MLNHAITATGQFGLFNKTVRQLFALIPRLATASALRKRYANFANILLFAITSASLLLTPALSYADFRKALTAYQNRDGQTMLKEVQDAVDKKNDDGLILFLSVLELDSLLASDQKILSSYEEQIQEYSTKNAANRMPVWKTILSDVDTVHLLSLLEIATVRSSLESQYRLLSLKFHSDIRVTELKFPDRIGMVTLRSSAENDKEFEYNLRKLIDKGYSNGAYYFINKYAYRMITESQITETAKTTDAWKKYLQALVILELN